MAHTIVDTTMDQTDLPDDSSDNEYMVNDDYASLTSEAGEYEFNNGRRYHGYKAGRYYMPNDEHEMDREDMKHHIAMLLTEGRLHLAPISSNPKKILDIGTGIGIWAIEMADAYPDAQVIATDLSPIQPTWVPPNMIIEIDDAEDEWLYKPNSIDFVHTRAMFFAIHNWPRLMDQAMKALKPGGWIECSEIHPHVSSPDGTKPPKSQIQEFYEVLRSLGKEIGIDLDAGPKLKGILEQAGYEDVTEVIYDVPLGDWPEDRRLNEIGRYHVFQFVNGVQGIGQALLMRIGGWTREKMEVFFAGIRREGNDRRVHVLNKMYFVYGRKPLPIVEGSGISG